VLLYRQLSEVESLLDDGDALDRLTAAATCKKLFLALRVPSSQTQRNSDLQKRLSRLQLDTRVQVLTVADEAELAETVCGLSRALEKASDLQQQPPLAGFKAVRVAGGADGKCGLRKLWQAQLQVLWNSAQRKKNYAFRDVASARVVRERLSAGEDAEAVVFGDEAAQSRPNATFLEALKAQLNAD
jgi:hypothetical protein